MSSDPAMARRAMGFRTPEEAEESFYHASETADLGLMMEIWSADADVVCIHPLGPRLLGPSRVRESWRQILGAGASLRISVQDRVKLTGGDLVIHIVHEMITMVGDSRMRPPIIATNGYRRSEGRWHMVLHHASPAPAVRTEPGPGSDAVH